ncbi:hypothetical protein EIN_186030 [Entamoeba invadens IP1]|uniref:hypothetical protein n=1 Tax=Entamoeba invadens IP1 TaxID=370355 RepID=UPI0002C3E512|nr:hypothetical protein EIN_186030 [Entamoeba invadens IP1]ELP94186.1 hypothetical protein EIN_186030 [Entamoeba invadens IP1]|eukprot:XP_004260957.1 hypothetical protein EIN_186030 [Entamoeba invadens IP1]
MLYLLFWIFCWGVCAEEGDNADFLFDNELLGGEVNDIIDEFKLNDNEDHEDDFEDFEFDDYTTDKNEDNANEEKEDKDDESNKDEEDVGMTNTDFGYTNGMYANEFDDTKDSNEFQLNDDGIIDKIKEKLNSGALGHTGKKVLNKLVHKGSKYAKKFLNKHLGLDEDSTPSYSKKKVRGCDARSFYHNMYWNGYDQYFLGYASYPYLYYSPLRRWY